MEMKLGEIARLDVTADYACVVCQRIFLASWKSGSWKVWRLRCSLLSGTPTAQNTIQSHIPLANGKLLPSSLTHKRGTRA
jgi:hypothetical protein